MIKYKLLYILGAVLLILQGCKDEELAPIVTFDSAGKGSYPKLVERSGGDIKLDDLGGSVHSYNVEFIDLEGGSLVAEFKQEVSFTDYDESDGNSSTGPVVIRTFTSADFSPQGTGNLGVAVSETGTDLLNALGLTADDLSGGGQFDITSTITTVDGATFRSTNSSATVNGSAFRGFFDYSLFVVCPSDLAGTYAVATEGTSTDGCCPGPYSVEAEVTLTETAPGEYEISDWSGGLYIEWYTIYGILPSHMPGSIKDACGVITLLTDAEPFGESLKGDGIVNDDGTITLSWVTGYGDKGTLTMTPK